MGQCSSGLKKIQKGSVTTESTIVSQSFQGIKSKLLRVSGCETEGVIGDSESMEERSSVSKCRSYSPCYLTH